jgi:electron transfer flavoprotein beta subunit
MGAKSKPQEVLALADVGVEAERVGESGSRTVVRSSSPPPPKSGQVKIEDDGSAAEKIVEYLAEKRLI